MQNDKDLFNLIKEAYPLQPEQEFVSSTEFKLRQRARKMTKKHMIKRVSFVSSGFVLFVLAFSWFFFFSGKDIVLNTLTSLGENETKTQDKNIQTIEAVLQNSLTGPSDELKQILDKDSEEKFVALNQHNENLFKDYFANEMAYTEFVNSYGSTLMVQSNGVNIVYYKFKIKNIEYEKVDAKDIVYNFSVELQLQREGSEKAKIEIVNGQANLNEENKIEDMVIRTKDLSNSMIN